MVVGGPVGPVGRVVLVDVDEAVLDELVRVATTDAAADEVTPRVTPGPVWTEARVAWLRRFHRDRRTGLDGSHGEATWAVVAVGRVVGSVRLQRTPRPDVLETGIWLARTARGRGLGTAAVAEVVRRAAALGATVSADTDAANAAALALLERAGCTLSPADASGSVRALLDGSPPAAPPS